MTSIPRNAWRYLTRSDVTWRQASEGSALLVSLTAVTVALVGTRWGLRRSRLR